MTGKPFTNQLAIYAKWRFLAFLKSPKTVLHISDVISWLCPLCCSDQHISTPKASTSTLRNWKDYLPFSMPTNPYGGNSNKALTHRFEEEVKKTLI